MTEENNLVNEENVKRFLKFLESEQKPKENQKKIISSAVNAPYELAKNLHENFSVFFQGEECVYVVERYKNGGYGFYDLEPISLYQRGLLLRQYFPEIYLNEKLSNAQKKQKLEQNLRVSKSSFLPHEPFVLSNGAINRYAIPYWLKVKMGIVPEPKNRAAPKGQLTELQYRFFMHLFPDQTARHRVLMFGKKSMYSRLQKAMLLMGASSTGKSALIAMFAGLHYPNCSNKYNVKKFFTKQFAWGALQNTTFTGVNEGIIEKDYLPDLKNFITNDSFDARQLYELEKIGIRNYNTLMISSDLSECINSADQATLNRLIIPQTTTEPIIGAESYTMDGKKAPPFTEQEISRIYNMSTFVNKEQAEADTLALAEFLEVFEDPAINLNSAEVSGFQNKIVAGENFYEGLPVWKKRFILEVLYPYLKKQTSKDGFYLVEFPIIERARKKAMKLFEIGTALREDKKTGISLLALQELGKVDRTIFISKQPVSTERKFYYEISADFVDNFLTSIADTPDKET